ncbi:MAG: hypothetical protein CMJ18_11990 [Phycisphaeraceae bacterium]|nr:hypothetical protein [Phycisphaeraceae bacterium]
MSLLRLQDMVRSFAVVLCALPAGAAVAESDPAPKASSDIIYLRGAFGVRTRFDLGPYAQALRQITRSFRERYPNIHPVSGRGLNLATGSTVRNWDIGPMMRIAGDVAPDTLYVNFRRSGNYIHKKLLYPLDRYIEELAGVTVPDGSAMSSSDYVAVLREGDHFTRVAQSIPDPCWPVIHRLCPYRAECPYREQWGLAPLEKHRHVWAFPVAPLAIAMRYNKALFSEYGIEQRPPRDWPELMRWAKILTDPTKGRFGLAIPVQALGWYYTIFLYSAGGQALHHDGEENWHCVLDSDEAVDAAYFFARLRLEKIERDGHVYRGVIGASFDGRSSGPIEYGMNFMHIQYLALAAGTYQNYGFGPVPAGPTGVVRSRFNAQMMGIFSGLAHDERRRDATWKYITFWDGPEARRIHVEKYVEAGLGRYVRPLLLRQFNEDGRYDSILRRIPPEIDAAYAVFEDGVPQPYGRNCELFYNELNKPLGAIWRSEIVRDAIDRDEPDVGKAEIRRILSRATDRINLKMLGKLPEPVLARRNRTAWVVIVVVVITFVLVLRRVFRYFTPPQQMARGLWQFGRYGRAYILMAPAILSIALWMYWPLMKGTVIAFQDYSVLGESEWVGADNFAEVLYDSEFWHSLKVSLYYGLLFVVFGFAAPIALAFLLHEIPRGRILLRTIYYLPAVLAGVVVIFLWKSFYGPEGLLNQVINAGIWVANLLPGVDMPLVFENWLENERMVLFFSLLPTVWAGAGPGCLIYLAALKTIPEELYEAADVDGAGIRDKVFGVALPSIRALIVINFIGAVIGAIRGSGGFMLAMTGGGPYSESGGATEVVGLKLFYTTFGYLNFGVGAAMAWVLGAMLIGFTVLQLKRLSRMEFRTATTGD